VRARKVFRIYAALPDVERKAFGTYLACPLFNTSNRLIAFRQVLEEELVQKPGRQLSVEETWNQIPGIGTDFRANGFDKLCAELLSALNDFLALQTFRAHPAQVASRQLEAYLAHQLDEWIPGLFETTLERLEKELESGAEGIHAHLRLLEDYGVFLFRQPRMPYGDHLIRIDEKLNQYFITKKLELASLVDVYNRAFNGDLELPFLDILQTGIDQVRDQLPLLIRLRVLAWLLTSTRNDRYYWELKSLLLDAYRDIAAEEARPLFHLALNHCTYKTIAGELEFEAEADALQLIMLEKGLFLVDGKLPPETFKNIVQLRLSLGHTEWVARFLEQWEHQLSNDHGGCALVYNQAVLAFYEDRFGDCMRGMEIVLRDFKNDVFYGPAARGYLLMSAFEQEKVAGDPLDLDTRIHAFRMYLIRENRIGETLKERYLNFVKVLRKLITLASDGDSPRKSRSTKLLRDLDQLKPVASRNWLRKQVLGFLD
jgi:hypothetical protein